MRSKIEAAAALATAAMVEVRACMVRSVIVTLAAIAAAASAHAATFTVTSTADSGAGTLRQAIIDANNAAGADAIVFAPGFGGVGGPTITLLSPLTIASDLTIDGLPDRQILLNGGLAVRVLQISSGNVQINGVTIFGGRALPPNSGGCVNITQGTTTFNRVTIWNCQAGNGGALTIDNGVLNINNSTVFGNTATTGGGGLFVNSSGATVNIVSSTFASNTAVSGGAVSVAAGTVNIRNSIFGDNSATTGTEIGGGVNSQGYNLIENASGATIGGNTTGNQTGADAGLSFVDLNGGGTRTQALNNGSPAIDAGDPGLATTLDQRSARRNTDGDRNGSNGVDIGAYERQTTAFDFNGEGSADLSVMRVNIPSASGAAVVGQPRVWYYGFTQVLSLQDGFAPNPTAVSSVQFGFDDDIPVPADYDGDGRTDVAVFRPTTGIWYLNRSTAGFQALQWGLAGDVPVQADYDGDGKADIAVFRSGTWYILRSQSGYTGPLTLGNANSKPVPADYDGDLKADPAIFDNGQWTVNNSLSGTSSTQFGLAGDVPVPADYDGDGKSNIAVVRPTNGTWYVLRPAGGFDASQFGLAGDRYVPADYDGDGRTDLAVWRANIQNGRGIWYLLCSRDGFVQNDFGLSTDVATPNSQIRQ